MRASPVSLLKRYRRSRGNQGTRYCRKGPDALSNERYKQSLTPSDIRGRSLISNFKYIEIEGAVRKSLTGGGGYEFFGHFQHWSSTQRTWSKVLKRMAHVDLICMMYQEEHSANKRKWKGNWHYRGGKL